MRPTNLTIQEFCRATYTVTELTPPAHFTGAPPQTITVDQGIDGPDNVTFYNTYTGGPVPGRVAVSVFTSQLGAPLSGPVFAVTGPGLPALTTPPEPGTFAELDIGDDESVCPAHEPSGVTCEYGMITGLQSTTEYLVTQIQAAPGFAIEPPQHVDTRADGHPTVAHFQYKPV